MDCEYNSTHVAKAWAIAGAASAYATLQAQSGAVNYQARLDGSDGSFDVDGCVVDGTCEVFTEDGLEIIKKIRASGKGEFDIFGHERYDIKSLLPKYPYLFKKSVHKDENEIEETKYFERLGAKSDLLYTAVVQLDQRVRDLEEAKPL